MLETNKIVTIFRLVRETLHFFPLWQAVVLSMKNTLYVPKYRKKINWSTKERHD